MLLCSRMFATGRGEITGHACLQLVQSHFRTCAYIFVLFSDHKENKKTRKSQKSSKLPTLTSPAGRLLPRDAQWPHSQSPRRCFEFKGHAFQLDTWMSFCCGCRKSRPLSQNCTFRADCRLSRCSPVYCVCLCEKSLLVQCLPSITYVDERCQNVVVNLKHSAVASMFVVLEKVSNRVHCSPFCIVSVTRSVFRAGYILCIPQ